MRLKGLAARGRTPRRTETGETPAWQGARSAHIGRMQAFRHGLLTLALAAIGLSGCGSLIQSATSGLTEQLGAAVLSHDDPELVRDATPTLLILIDSLAGEDAGPAVLGSAAQLYAAYGVVFVNEPERAHKLTERAYGYGRRALCAADRAGCGVQQLGFDEYEARIGAYPAAKAQALYDYVLGYLAWIQAHGDYEALARLPRLQVALNRLLDVAPPGIRGRAHMYMGVLQCLRPASLGGEPEKGMRNFDEALRLTERKDLGVLVEYARNCARLLYDRELHDRLLEEVVDAPADQPGLTLFNNLAKADARELLSTADEYF